MGVHAFHHIAPSAHRVDPTIPVADIIIVGAEGAVIHTNGVNLGCRLDREVGASDKKGSGFLRIGLGECKEIPECEQESHNCDFKIISMVMTKLMLEIY